MPKIQVDYKIFISNESGTEINQAKKIFQSVEDASTYARAVLEQAGLEFLTYRRIAEPKPKPPPQPKKEVK